MDLISIQLSKLAEVNQEKVLFFPQEDLAFNLQELLTEIKKFHSCLSHYGVLPGDTVSVISGNCAAMVVSLLGSITYGSIFMPINPNLKKFEILHLLEHAQPKLLLSHLDQAEFPSSAYLSANISTYTNYPAANTFPLEQQDTGGVLIYTSGTTGAPKGVFLSEPSILFNLAAVQKFLKRGKQHIGACILPLFHMFTVISDLFSNLLHGGKVVVLPEFGLGLIPLIAQSINQFGVNNFSAVPLIFDLLVRMDAPIRPGQLDFCVSGGAPLREEVRLGFNKKFASKIVPAYGVTEGVCFCLCSDPDQIIPSSAGLPVGIEIEIVDENGQILPEDEVGELVLKGESIIANGYYKDSRECYLSLGGEKWFRTGDLGKRGANGAYYITGRLKNMIIKGGAKIYLEDVDQFMMSIQGIKDVASIKLGKRLGEDIEQFISFICLLEPLADQVLQQAAIKKRLQDALGSQKVPDKLFFLEEIPRTATGKVKMQSLQQIIAENDL